MAQLKTVAVSLTIDLTESLQRAAEEETTSVSDIVRRALRRYFFDPNVTPHNGLVDSPAHYPEPINKPTKADSDLVSAERAV